MLTKERILLSNYCRLDFEGARLSPGGWDGSAAYTSMSSNPDYNRLAIVTRYSVDVACRLPETRHREPRSFM